MALGGTALKENRSPDEPVIEVEGENDTDPNGRPDGVKIRVLYRIWERLQLVGSFGFDNDGRPSEIKGGLVILIGPKQR